MKLSSPKTDNIPEPLAGKIRAGQIAAVLRLTPAMMVANLLNVVTVIWLFQDSASGAFIAAWSALTILVVLTGFRSWWRHKSFLAHDVLKLPPRSRRSIRRMIINAGVMALIWSLVPIALFSNSSSGGQIFIAVLTSGMMSAGALALSTVPVAALTYISILALSAAYALLTASEPAYSFVGIILFLYTWILAKSVVWNANLFINGLIDRSELEKQNELISLLLRDFEESASDWLWEINEEGRLQHVSVRLATMLCKSPEELMDSHFHEVFRARSEHDAIDELKTLRDLVAKRAAFRDLVVPITISDEDSWWSLSGKPVFDENGLYRGHRGVCADVTKTRQAQERIAQMARVDGLTGLANRASFYETLDALSSEGQGSNWPIAILYLDLDQFKAVNDSGGHAIGDRLLTNVARRLVAAAGDARAVARLAGDEFAVLLSNFDKERDVLDLADWIIHSLSQPYQLDGRQLQIGVSIGIALSQDDSEDPEQTMKNADLALYAAKKNGRGQFKVFGPEINAAVRKRLEMAQDLQAALIAGDLALHYQPIMSAKDSRLVGFEALLRWNHPENGMISPADFIPVAEECGLIDEIGTWVIRRACDEAARWPTPVKVAVNLSSIQFHNPQLLNIILAAIGASGLPAQRLELEITESALLSQNATTLETLNHLRSIGVAIALDDFGTGYASLAYLRGFPFDKIKIDQSFVSEALERPDCAAIIKAVIYLANSLDMICTAEGVETFEQFEWLRAVGCTQVQGYLFSRALPAEGLTSLFAQGEYPFSKVA